MFYNEPEPDHPPNDSSNSLRAVADEIMDSWRSGSRPDALAALDRHPQLRNRHSLAIDLAYEEYCLREEGGETVDPKEFCQKFTRLKGSLARMLNLHQVLQSSSLGNTKAPATDWPVLGTHWCGWTLQEELGRGTFSRVYLAEETAIGNRKVVIKCSTSGPGEAFVLGRLEHPHVMPIHSIQHDPGRGLVGICMPFFGRITLAETLDQLLSGDESDLPGNSPLFQASLESSSTPYSLAVAKLLEKVARGLAAAHHAGVLHGDIKPSNIILSFAGEPLLVDFNLSTDQERGQLRIGGTPPYMAPERLPALSLHDSPADDRPDFSSDVFSLGVVLCEVLYGQPPFEVQVDGFQVRYDSAMPALPERDIADQVVPSRLRQILTQAIAIEPAERFETANELAEALGNFLKQVVPSQSQEVTQVETRPTAKRIAWAGRLLPAALLIGVLLGLAAFGFSSRLGHSQTHQLLQAAIQDIEERDFVSAAERLELVHAKLPRKEILAWQGWCLAERGKYDLAKMCFEKADPDSDVTGTLWHNIGCCNLLRGAPNIAITDFSKAIVRNPACGVSYWQRAMAKTRHAMLVNSKPISGTFEDIEFALRDQKVDPYLYFDAARVYAFGYKYTPALKDKCELSILRALESGIPPEQFDSVAFAEFEIPILDTVRVASIAKSRKIDSLRIPPFDLVALLKPQNP